MAPPAVLGTPLFWGRRGSIAIKDADTADNHCSNHLNCRTWWSSCCSSCCCAGAWLHLHLAMAWELRPSHFLEGLPSVQQQASALASALAWGSWIGPLPPLAWALVQ